MLRRGLTEPRFPRFLEQQDWVERSLVRGRLRGKRLSFSGSYIRTTKTEQNGSRLPSLNSFLQTQHLVRYKFQFWEAKFLSTLANACCPVLGMPPQSMLFHPHLL